MSARTRWTAVSVVVALAITGCSASTPGSSGGNKPQKPGKPGTPSAQQIDGDVTAGLTDAQKDHLLTDVDTTWDVTYKPDTTLVSGDGLAALKSEDASGTYTFDEKAARAAGLDLDKGRVLLLAGKALRRITSVKSDGGTITVKTEQASLDDAIQAGTVAWDVPIEFDFDQFFTDVKPGKLKSEPSAMKLGGLTATTPQLSQISMAMPDGRTVPVMSSDDDSIAEALLDSIEVKPESGSVAWTFSSHGNKYQFRLTSKGDSVDILIVVSRGGDAKPTMAFRAEGSMGSFRSSSNNTYAGGSLATSDVKLDNLSGDLKLSLAAAGAGSAPVEMDVPVPMLTFTWMVGPVPVTIDIKAKIVGNIKTEVNASATAKSSFTYKGDVGFKYQGTKVTASGATDVDEMDPEPADSAAPMSVNVDAQFGVAFPYVSLSILGQGLIPNIKLGTVIGTSLQWGGPAAGFPASSICKSAYVRMEVTGGYDFEILGRKLASDEFDIYKDKKKVRNDSCPPEDE